MNTNICASDKYVVIIYTHSYWQIKGAFLRWLKRYLIFFNIVLHQQRHKKHRFYYSFKISTHCLL